jgi:hypothetical protein
MKKLMNHIVLKLVLCTGIFCGTNFGMEKEQAISHKAQTKLYVDESHKSFVAYNCYRDSVHVSAHRSIGEYGIFFSVKNSTQQKIVLAKTFKNCHLVLQNQECYVKGGADYILSVIAKEPNLLDPDLVPVRFSKSQVQEMIRLICAKKNEVFVLDEYGHRLDIVDVSLGVAVSVQDAKEYSVPQRRQNYWYDYPANPDCTIS